MADKFVDCIVEAFAINSKVESHRELIDWMGVYWRDFLHREPPVILSVPTPPSSGHPNFAQVVSDKQVGGMSFLESFVKARAADFPSGHDLGRIGLVGFSAGCGMVRQVLSDPQDAARVSFAYFCDGLHGSWDGAKGAPNLSPVARLSDPDSGAARVLRAGGVNAASAFALQAATGNTCMVNTYSEVIPEGYPSTTEVAHAINSDVRNASVASEYSLNDPGFTGQNSSLEPAPPQNADGTYRYADSVGPYWPSKWGAMCGGASAKIRPPWPIREYYQKGAYLAAGFRARDEENQQSGRLCDAGVNSQPAHIWQDHYVLPEVFKHVLAEYWAPVCTKGAFSGLGQTDDEVCMLIGKGAGFLTAEQIAAAKALRYGTTAALFAAMGWLGYKRYMEL